MQTSRMVHYRDLDTITRSCENEQINEQKALVFNNNGQSMTLSLEPISKQIWCTHTIVQLNTATIQWFKKRTKHTKSKQQNTYLAIAAA